ncbi:MAG TPA: formylglycine-generating enzyme family protein, partial [Pseudodesulfovibrio sp.]|nr:formylglycine-generating enzyme family protein [Pseudodesulfovibrio sp.]
NETVEVDGNLRTATIQTDEGARFYRLQNTPQTPIPPNPNPDTLVWMTPGTFLMGSPVTEPEREALVPTTGYGDETQHEVTLTQGYWMAKYETTQEEYTAIMGSNPSASAGVNLPVESVTWYESVAYCEQLTAQEAAAGRLPEGYVYRLPTEAEWEYACRAGTSTAFFLGDELWSWQANFAGTREYSVSEGGTVDNPNGTLIGHTMLVGFSRYTPNAWGLYGMLGNVREWCADRIDHYPSGPVADPATPEPTNDWSAVQRGGHWGAPGAYCRSAHRDFHFPTFRNSHYGFRVVLARPLP